MKRIKKVITVIALTVMLVTVAAISGCSCEFHKDKEVGDFYVRFYDDYCAIKGTTEQGNNKRFLVIPESIDGVQMKQLGVNRTSIIMGSISKPDIESDVIEKVYFEGDFFTHANALSYCTNLKKIMFAKGDSHNLGWTPGRYYYPYKVYKRDYASIIDYYGDDFWKTPANISYYYNYASAVNEGYYWIDDCEYGEKIEYIPEDPVREGYTFGGWYKDADCKNKWNFGTDRLPVEKTEIGVNNYGNEAVIKVYQETILYAKWA